MFSIGNTAVLGGILVALCLIAATWDGVKADIAKTRHANYLKHQQFMVANGVMQAKAPEGEGD